ncbi:MAG: homocysteine S-methyltransferase family protein [Alphaproteobacteria bacterium]|nr:homocysteine S-methyltransferase family protein [Alphaproteobacteria bacterium]
MIHANEKPLMIMDGGMGRELERMGAPFKQPEWSALALMDAPEAVRAAHDNFIEAGAEVIITNSYAVVPFHIGQERFDTRGRELIALSGKLAREAADNAEHNVLVAGSIPPLFGSYLPKAFDPDKADDILIPLIEEQDPFIDVWVMETVSSIKEAKFVCDALSKTGKPIWVGYTLTDRDDYNRPSTIRSGEAVEQAIQAALPYDSVEAILFNCSQPEEMEDAITAAASIVPKNIVLGAYSNKFDKKLDDNHEANGEYTAFRNEFTPHIYYEFAQKWRAAGASIIGGCCGIGPEYIAYLKEHLS